MINAIEKIITPRLELRPYNADVAHELGEAITESLDLLLPWMPWAREEPLAIGKRIELIQSWGKDWDEGKDFVFAVFTRDGKYAGSTGLHLRVGPGAFETGYWIRKTCQGKGFATEAAYAMTKAGFNYGGIEKMIIRCDSKNEISARIPDHLGYRFSGESFSKIHNAMHLSFRLNRSDFINMDEFETTEIILKR